MSKTGTIEYSSFSGLAQKQSLSGWRVRHTERLGDYLQLAHYWRMVEAAGYAPAGRPVGFIIGTDAVPGCEGNAAIWLDLDAGLFKSYSRSRGTAMRSALEHYDHEHSFRLAVAQSAAMKAAPLVDPIAIAECDSCPWLDHCFSVVSPDAASVHIRSGRLDDGEWEALAALGVSTLDELAALNPDDEAFRARYLPEVTHQAHALRRVETAIRRARMLQDDRAIERETAGPIDVPRADIEIDLDAEWDPDDKVYLWGALVSAASLAPVYHAFVEWHELDDGTERVLATRVVVWLSEQVAAAERSGKTVAIYHYNHTERSLLTRIVGESAVAGLLPLFVDLLTIVRQHFFGSKGLSIKTVAPAFGFAWRDAEPSGLASQQWLLGARAAADATERDALRQRLLDYNEDDVRATAALRIGLAALG